MSVFTGIRAIADYAGVHESTAWRDIQACILREDYLTRSRKGRPAMTFTQATADSYREYRRSILFGTKAKNPKHRLKIKPTLDFQAALDKAWTAGYNAGRRARQREAVAHRLEGRPNG